MSPIQGPTPPPAAVNPPPAGQSFEALQAQFIAQTEQLAVLQAQQRILQNQIDRHVQSGPAFAALSAQRGALDALILKLQMDMAATRTQLAGRIRIPNERFGLGQPPQAPRRSPDPDVIVGMSFTLAIAVAFPLAIAYARRIWRGKPAAASQSDMIAPRLDRLEQAVDAIAIEIERVAEGQRFVTKVFAERGSQAHVSAESPLARDSASALGEAKPFLALGAGPLEPIRVAERQAVRQSITPH